MDNSYDVIIIGGGFLGLTSAYELAKQGVKTLLLEAGDIGGGTSGSCSGRAQVCEGLLDPLNLRLIVDGLASFENLEEELGFNFEWRKSGLFLIIRTQSSKHHWEQRLPTLNVNGIPTEIIDRSTLQKAEPNMNTNNLFGAVYTQEGMLNPLKFSLGYAAAARRRGAKIQGNTRVTGLQVENSRVVALKTAQDTFYCNQLAVMTGAWVPEITRMVNLEVPIYHTHAEAVVTEPLPPMIFNNIEIADFYDTIHGKQRAVAIGIHQDPHGSIDITEAVTRTDQFHKGVSAWGITSLAQEFIALYPSLANTRIVRGWGRPTSFTPDEEPLIGWLAGVENLFIAASLMETITVLPILSKWIALMLQGKPTPVSLNQYSPARFF